jgi:IS4 transposase
LCAPLQSGEIALFDKAYIAFDFLWELSERGVYFVTRSKENLKFRVVKRRIKKPVGNILRDDEVLLSLPGSRNAYPQRLRRVTAVVELEGRGLVEMTFLSNNFEWAPGSIAELYRCRWAIEAFFKQIKQTLKLGGFLGQNRNAIEWQIWTALLVYLLLRFLAWRSQWPHSFTRIFTVVRALLWDGMDIDLTLRSCGTASGHFKLLRGPTQAYLPGFG